MAGIRVGNVSSVDYENGMIQVTYPSMDDCVTDYFPVLTLGDEYRMPDPGDDVLVVHLSNGVATGIVIGTFYSDDNPPEEYGADLFRKELSREIGEAYIKYQNKIFEIKCPDINFVTEHGNIKMSSIIRKLSLI